MKADSVPGMIPEQMSRSTPVQHRNGWLIALIIILVIIIVTPVLLGIIILIAIAASSGSADLNMAGNVALIPVDGVIATQSSSGLLGEATISSTDIVDMIQKADENNNVKAIVFEINSPGGSPVASDEVGQAIKRSNKTTVALIRDIGTSGAYWIASACDVIIANRMSFTGSIGVTSSYLEFSGLLKDYNITYERLVAGKYKDIGAPYRSLTDQERAMLQAQLDTMHTYFIEEVATNRHQDPAKIRELATGMFFLGAQAKDYGLVDILGGQREAEELIKEKTGISKIEYVKYSRKTSLLQELSSIISSNQFSLKTAGSLIENEKPKAMLTG
jgi:protease IV